MPQFELDLGSHKGIQDFNRLDTFTRSYVEAMFWTECSPDNPELEDASFDQLAPEALASCVKDCELFQLENEEALEEACGSEAVSYDMGHAGHDYWLTRNGHGAGFRDRGLGEVGDRLAEAARYSEVSLYRGDDGRLYV